LDHLLPRFVLRLEADVDVVLGVATVADGHAGCRLAGGLDVDGGHLLRLRGAGKDETDDRRRYGVRAELAQPWPRRRLVRHRNRSNAQRSLPEAPLDRTAS